jgi:tRNA 2-selenouridine synthase
MTTSLPIEQFLELSRALPIFDVRAPAEFTHGHIPGAHNLPLFTDEQRAAVGTLYAQQGKQAAITKGLEFVGPHLTGIVEHVKTYTESKTILVHCWRGGMRSKSIAWLLSLTGYDVYLLDGGYKSYRAHVRSRFEQPYQFMVIGGTTGSGKSLLLEKLKQHGQQIIDLEQLAHHRGSAFGALGQKPQPTQAQFENDLAQALMHYDMLQPIWIEDESLRIGSLFIPQPLFKTMRQAPLIHIEVDQQTRIETIKAMYGTFSTTDLITCVTSISEHLGGTRTKELIQLITENHLDEAIVRLLDYYDKKYTFGLTQHDQKQVTTITLAGNDYDHHAQALINHVCKS